MFYSVVKCPVGTVSLAFHCERLLGEPSIHLCRSRPRSGLRGSNSHFQSQSLVFCRLNEARVSVGLERLELSPRGVKIRCAAVTPQTQNGCVVERLRWSNMSWAS
jgi:hypothetical protein